MAEPQTIEWNSGARVLIDADNISIQNFDPKTGQWLEVPSDTFIIFWSGGE
jgi:hypothetical protein